MNSFKLVSLNIHKGFNTLGSEQTLGGLKRALHTTGADFAFLQEVLGDHEAPHHHIEGWKNTAQFEFLADQIWSHYAYGKNAVYAEGHHGNAILSQFPILKWDNLDISAHNFEMRGLLHAEIESLHLLTLHLALFERHRNWQFEQVANYISKHIPKDAPLLLTGDFNDWGCKATPYFAERLGLTEAFFSLHHHHARTFPSFLPVLCLDRVYGRGVQWDEARVLKDRVWSRLTDHAALEVQFSLLKPASK